MPNHPISIDSYADTIVDPQQKQQFYQLMRIASEEKLKENGQISARAQECIASAAYILEVYGNKIRATIQDNNPHTHV